MPDIKPGSRDNKGGISTPTSHLSLASSSIFLVTLHCVYTIVPLPFSDAVKLMQCAAWNIKYRHSPYRLRDFYRPHIHTGYTISVSVVVILPVFQGRLYGDNFDIFLCIMPSY